MRVRLQKLLAEAGLGSRRHAETLIQRGRVAVNGQIVTQLGSQADPETDTVTVDGRAVCREPKLYIALHKPAGVVCTNADPQGRRRVVDLLPGTLPRLYSVGRLDFDSEGLLLLTNDGEFSLRLTHPRYKLPKTYRVEVVGRVSPAEQQRLRSGIIDDGEELHADEIVETRAGDGISELTVVLRQGKKRQIRRLFAAVGHPVRRLVRTAIGNLQLGDLKPNQWRHLSHEEVQQLQNGVDSGEHRRVAGEHDRARRLRRSEDGRQPAGGGGRRHTRRKGQ